MSKRGVLLFTIIAAVLAAQELREFKIAPVEPAGSHHNSLGESSINADRIELRNLLGFVFRVGTVRVVGPDWLDDTYKVTAKGPEGDQDKFFAALQRAILDKLQLRAERVSREMPVYLLSSVDPNAPKLHVGTGARSIRGQNGSVKIENASMADIAELLERTFGRPVLDDTKLKDNYSFELSWQAGDSESLKKALRDELGLTLTEATRKIDVLQVDRR